MLELMLRLYLTGLVMIAHALNGATAVYDSVFGRGTASVR